ncbi:MAG: hypothetical protein E6X17_06005 [Sporomusaceae bacterium]|nr:hypothetical protein [Sporomusaceae bacterium]
MQKRETEKIITLGERKFKIEKFDALTGSYIAFILAEKFLPAAVEREAGLTAMPRGRTSLSRQEFTELQKDCLSVVSEMLPAGARPVIAENGGWGVNDIAKDTRLVLLLTIHALAFNIAGFFGGAGLQELKAALADTISANTPT